MAGFPREANRTVEVGGVRTLFRMRDLLSLGLGGGSVVDEETVGLVEVEDFPLAYLPGDALRVRVRVVGDAESGATHELP